MWLVLCDPSDAAALWAVVGLRRRGVRPLEVVSPEALLYSRSIAHEIRAGVARTTFALPDGRPLRSEDVRGVLNRATTLPVAHLSGASREDAAYAQHENYALVLSVLHALGATAINRPTSSSLAGCLWTTPEWLMAAARVGLACWPWARSTRAPITDDDRPPGTRRDIIMLDGITYGARLPADVSRGCAALAAAADARLLGIDLCEDADGAWWFVGASPRPDLRLGGAPLLDGLAHAFGATP